MSLEQSPDSSLIDALGGTAEVARLCDVSMQAVSNWRQDGIPKARRMYLAAVRPAAFAVLPIEGTDAAGELRVEAVPQMVQAAT